MKLKVEVNGFMKLKHLMLGLVAGGALMLSSAQPAKAQINLHIPGTGINFNYDPFDSGYNSGYYNNGYYNDYNYRNPYYYNQYPYNNNNYYYNNYNNGFWVDGNGRAHWNGDYYTGWRNDVYYRNGWAVRYRR